eukprot:g6267.t1
MRLLFQCFVFAIADGILVSSLPPEELVKSCNCDRFFRLGPTAGCECGDPQLSGVNGCCNLGLGLCSDVCSAERVQKVQSECLNDGENGEDEEVCKSLNAAVENVKSAEGALLDEDAGTVEQKLKEARENVVTVQTLVTNALTSLDKLRAERTALRYSEAVEKYHNWVLRSNRDMTHGHVKGAESPNYGGTFNTIDEVLQMLNMSDSEKAVFFTWYSPMHQDNDLRGRAFFWSKQVAEEKELVDPEKWRESLDTISGYNIDRHKPADEKRHLSSLFHAGDYGEVARVWSKFNFDEGDSQTSLKTATFVDAAKRLLEDLFRNQEKLVMKTNDDGPEDDSVLGSRSNPASSCEEIFKLKKEKGSSDSSLVGGVFWINTYDMTSNEVDAKHGIGVGPYRVYCDLGEYGEDGGWTLLMKISAESDGTFKYNSEHWSKGTLLNDESLNTKVTEDAKFDTFNRLRVRELMAVWPSTKDAKPWRLGPFQSMTPLDFFQTPRTISKDPRNESWWNDVLHSSQSGGMQESAIALETRATKVRWGYAFNNLTSEGSSPNWDTVEGDVVGGIGTHIHSAGDSAPGGEGAEAIRRADMGNKSRAVLIFGRTGTEEMEKIAAEEKARAEAEMERNTRKRNNELKAKDEKNIIIDCGQHKSCQECASQDKCAWCLGQRLCVDDVAWICHGERYHVSHPDGAASSGPGKARCPTKDEMESSRLKRKERIERMLEQEKAREKRKKDRELRLKMRDLEKEIDDAESGKEGEKYDENEDPKLKLAREKVRLKRIETAREEFERIRQEMGLEDEKDGDDEEVKEGSESLEGKKKKKKKKVLTDEEIQHLEDLADRAAAADEESGANRPYEVLGISFDAKQTDVRKAYRKLSLKFHPDKNGGSADAHKAFEDIVAAYEVIGTPDKRAAFDEAAGMGSSDDFDANWESG